MILRKNKHFKLNFNKTFIKILSSYLIIISVILSVSSISFFSKYKELIIKNGYNISKRNLDQANHYTEFNFNWAKSFIYGLYLDEDIYKLMYSVSPNKEKTGITKLQQINSISQNIDSIYIYNNHDDKLYSSLGTKFVPEYDKAMRNLLISNTKTSFSGKFIPLKIEIASKKGNLLNKNILSIVLSNVSTSKNVMPNGAIILNINANIFSNYFKNTYKNDNILFSIDNTGKIIFSSDNQKFLNDISNEKYIKNILHSSTEDKFIESIKGTEYLVTYSSFKNSNLKFISLIPYESLIGESRDVINSYILIALLLLIIGVILSYILSHKIYSPINKLVRSVHNKLSPNNITDYKSRNELDYLSEALEHILSQSFTLNKLPLEDVIFIRKRFIRDLLTTNELKNTQEYKLKLDQLNINIDTENILVIIFKIDSLNSFLEEYSTENDRYLIMLGVKNIISEIFSQECKVETIIIDHDIVTILSIDNKLTNDINNTILTSTKNITKNISDNLNVSISASIGSFAEDVTYVSESYNKALDYMKYTFKYGYNSILYADKILNDIQTDYKYNECLEKAIFDAIKLGNKEKVKISLDRIFQDILNYSYSNMLLYITNLSIHSKNLINNLYNINNIDNKVDIKTFIDDLKSLDSINDAKSWLLTLYEETIEKSCEKKLCKNDNIVEKIEKYVAENYANQCLSIEELSDYVNISPNYLRTIFKNVTNKSISKYLNDYRFEKAKSLLIDTDYTALKISELVGYSNSNYFYTAFKKNYGISPSEFRKVNKTEK